jgi:hypothetical protein
MTNSFAVLFQLNWADCELSATALRSVGADATNIEQLDKTSAKTSTDRKIKLHKLTFFNLIPPFKNIL